MNKLENAAETTLIKGGFLFSVINPYAVTCTYLQEGIMPETETSKRMFNHFHSLINLLLFSV